MMKKCRMQTRKFEKREVIWEHFQPLKELSISQTLLLPFPVFFSLYASLQAAVELYHVPFLWVPDLTSQDPYFILPLAMGAVMYLQTKLQPTPAADNEQAKMMQTLMPVIFTVMMLFLPAGLTVYIFASTVIGVIQTLAIVRPQANDDAAKAEAS